MSQAVAASRLRPAYYWGAGFGGLSLEAEIRSLVTMAPGSASQLPSLFAESVVKSCSSVLGESTGEALVRRIGDKKLGNPDEAYSRIDSLLLGGSDSLKRSIRASFRAKVHRLYRHAMTVQYPTQW